MGAGFAGVRGSVRVRPDGGVPALAARELLEPDEQVTARSVPARPRVEHAAATERVRWRDPAHHEAVAGGGDDRTLEADLPEPTAEPRQPRRRLARSVVDLHAL